MALREEMRNSGEWLFRWRSYVPLVPLALILALMLSGYRYFRGSPVLDAEWKLFCLLISLAGLAVRAVTVGFVPSGTSGRGTEAQRAATLNTEGMYSVARHPLYLGNYLMWAGVMLVPRHAWLFAVVTLFYWLYYERIMFAEEEFLRDGFGERYEAWAARTPAVLPRWSAWVRPRLPFSMRTVLKRELSSFFGMVATFAVLDVASHFGATRVWRLAPLWAGILAGGLVVFLILVALKRRTRVLDVAGR